MNFRLFWWLSCSVGLYSLSAMGFLRWLSGKSYHLPLQRHNIHGYMHVYIHKFILICIKFMQKRAPALLDNLTQAFLMAPFFVLFEVALYLVLLQFSYDCFFAFLFILYIESEFDFIFFAFIQTGSSNVLGIRTISRVSGQRESNDRSWHQRMEGKERKENFLAWIKLSSDCTVSILLVLINTGTGTNSCM